MGLTLHYKLRLHGTRTPDEVDMVLARLRQQAAMLPFHLVTDPCRLSEPDVPGCEQVNEFLRVTASVYAEPFSDDRPRCYGDLTTARAFLIDVAEGCEAATVGFFRRADEDGGNAEWFWQCSCKTQYASVVSDEHFVKTHALLVEFLDRIAALGVQVDVVDEGGYWETRDEKTLIGEVQKMNRIVAAFAGRLSDAIGDEHDIQAEIFKHPRFEHLEVEHPNDD